MKAHRYLGLLFGFAFLTIAATTISAESDPYILSADVAVVNTKAGNLQGFVHNGVSTFLGVQYAKSERFMPPTAVESWTGTKTAFTYGAIAPQMFADGIAPSTSIMIPQRYWKWPQSESPQNLNVWTPNATTKKPRPVMVWLHGGAFSYGSSNDMVAYDGENLSKTGDVVVVSINHRLNTLGFLDLSSYGEQYKYSANVGMMDIVVALQWIKDNISQFGGDPANVTLFGESGGGGKVLTLMAMPSAKGLFHKAIVQSGAFETLGMTLISRETSQRVAQLTLEFLGIGAQNIDSLSTIPYDRLAEVSARALNQTAQEQKLVGWNGMIYLQWAPIMDGDYIPVEPVGDSFAERSKDIPLLIGSNLTEVSTFGMLADISRSQSDNKNFWKPEEVKSRMEKQFGSKADAIAAAFSKAYPAKNPADVLYVDTRARLNVLKTARLKSEQNAAPVYTYMFSWESPVLGGFPMSYHTAEIPFVFNNIKLAESATGGGKDARKLAERMSRAWIQFARTGNPNNSKLPKWPAYTSKTGATMVFDTVCSVGYDYDQELMKLLTQK